MKSTKVVKELVDMMKDAEVEVKVEKKDTTIRPKKTFKDIIIQRIDMRARKLDILSYKPLRDEFCELLDILQRKLDEEKERQRIETATFRKLSKFSKDDITKYLDYLNEEAK